MWSHADSLNFKISFKKQGTNGQLVKEITLIIIA